jgi:hypothetical protein
MEHQKLDTVVREIYCTTYRLWETSRGGLKQDHDNGFKILYAPARFEPSVLVIGLQPGGSASNLRDAELRQPSASNEYLSESWTLARELRKRFGPTYLQGAIGTNAIFFRAPSRVIWRGIERQLRTQLEMFCVGENGRLIQAMQPKQILLLGWDALDLMRGGSEFRELVANRPGGGRRRRKRLLQSGRIEGVPAFAIPHPSKAWMNPPVTSEDWAMIAAGIGVSR